jgi:hypothetical protein
MTKYKSLKWTIDNFDFYYEGSESSHFSDLNSEIYNKKFKELLDNDEILCYNYNVIKKKWEWLKENRVTFDYFLNKEKEVIINEIQKAIDVIDFLNWYETQTGKCYINIVDKSTLKYLDEVDTIIFIEDAKGEIIGVLLPDGTTAPYDKKIYGTPETNKNSIVIVDPTGTGHISELNACLNKEIELVKEEYDFCG